MNHPVAVFAPQIEKPPAVVVHPQMLDLLPDSAVVVTASIDGAFGGHRNADRSF